METENKSTEIQQLENDKESVQVKLQKFVKIVQKLPKQEEVQTLNGAKYLPISFMEMQLDECFFGLWETKNFKFERVFNEMVGSITLTVTHPLTGQQLSRIGAGAVQIRQKANTDLVDFNDNKQKNALVMDFPKLKAECFKNACQSLGKYFGRDLNRKFEDQYNKLIKDESTVPEQVKKQIKEFMDVETLRNWALNQTDFDNNQEFRTLVQQQMIELEPA